jgi:high frequency lysogenization protein
VVGSSTRVADVAYQKRVLALAGILQAVHLVISIARTGLVSQDSMEGSLRSVFVVNPDSISSVYGGTSAVRVGLRLAAAVVDRIDLTEHGELIRYCLAVMALERSLAKRPAMLRELGAGIARVDEQRHLDAAGTDLTDDTIAALAGVYEATLSTIEPRIKILGRPDYLQNQINKRRIRSLLLAAMRSAVLWHQVGGRRWQLLLARRQMAEALKNLK